MTEKTFCEAIRDDLLRYRNLLVIQNGYAPSQDVKRIDAELEWLDRMHKMIMDMGVHND